MRANARRRNHGTSLMKAVNYHPCANEAAGRPVGLPVAAVRPLRADHLCYARTPSDDWKIAAIDQASL
jgi:hypothetical protein